MEWVYKNSKYALSDGYFAIKNPRVITIGDNDIDLLKDVIYKIECELYADYMFSSHYYENVRIYDNIVI